jgi:hypothetical protein
VEPLRHTVAPDVSQVSVTAAQMAWSPNPLRPPRLPPHHQRQRLPARSLRTVHAAAQPASPALARLSAHVAVNTVGVVAPPTIALLDVTHLSAHAQALLLLRLPRLPPLPPPPPRRFPLMEPAPERVASHALALLSVRAAHNSGTVVPPPATAELDAIRASESAPEQCPPSL